MERLSRKNWIWPKVDTLYYVRAIDHPLLIGTVLLHHSLELRSVDQRVLKFKPSYRTGVKLLYIVLYVIINVGNMEFVCVVIQMKVHFYPGPVLS